jgi:hypothetical protein
LLADERQGGPAADHHLSPQQAVRLDGDDRRARPGRQRDLRRQRQPRRLAQIVDLVEEVGVVGGRDPQAHGVHVGRHGDVSPELDHDLGGALLLATEQQHQQREGTQAGHHGTETRPGGMLPV